MCYSYTMKKINAYKCIIIIDGHKPFISHVRSIDQLRIMNKKYSNRRYVVLSRERVYETWVNSWVGVNVTLQEGLK